MTATARYLRPPVAVDGHEWVELLRVDLPVVPIGKGRPRSTLMAKNAKGGRRSAVGADRVADTAMVVYTPLQTRAWTIAVAAILRARARAQGVPRVGRHTPISVEVVARFEPPKAPLHPVLVVVKPDRDNVDKAVLDAVKAAGILPDDAQVVAGSATKVYAPPGERAGLLLVIHALRAIGEELVSVPPPAPRRAGRAKPPQPRPARAQVV